jgi:energy-coupling factor transporter ATP-binding protein EcfA2
LQFVPGGVTVAGRRLELPLDQVYVSLRGYPSSNANIRQGRGASNTTDRYEEPLGLQERDTAAQFAKLLAEPVDLAQAFRTQRTMVILGDPGSGKTTLCRWLALLTVRAVKNGEERLKVLAGAVDSGSADPKRVLDLGRAHLPIFMRIADVEEKYAKCKSGATLDDLLGASQTFGCPVYLDGDQVGQKVDAEDLTIFLRGYLGRNQASVFLDGLDELADPLARGKIVALVHRFLDDHFKESSDAGGRLVVTSRIIGYELHPLRDSVSKFTIERLKPEAVQVFSHTWHRAYFEQAGVDGADAAAKSGSERFLAQVFNPSRTALRELASNPLLLTDPAMK